MRNDPSYKTRVMAQLKSYYSGRPGNHSVRNSTADQRIQSLDFCGNDMNLFSPNKPYATGNNSPRDDSFNPENILSSQFSPSNAETVRKNAIDLMPNNDLMPNRNLKH